jgi:hypothetical protein
MVSVLFLGATDLEFDTVTMIIEHIWQDKSVNADDDDNTCPDGVVVGSSTIVLQVAL